MQLYVVTLYVCINVNLAIQIQNLNHGKKHVGESVADKSHQHKEENQTLDNRSQHASIHKIIKNNNPNALNNSIKSVNLKPSSDTHIIERKSSVSKSINAKKENVTEISLPANMIMICRICFCPDIRPKCQPCCSGDDNDDDEEEVKRSPGNEGPAPVVSNEIEDCGSCNCPQDSSEEKCKTCLTCSPDTKLQKLSLTKESFNDHYHSESNAKDSGPATDISDLNGNSKNYIDMTPAAVPDNDMFKYIFGDTIIMIIAPVLMMLIFIIYRKTKHLYQRWHYTRTNFLIDGMYSERNPLCVSDVIQLSDR